MKFQNHFGLHIGSSTIKVVELTQSGDNFKLMAIGMAPLPVGSDASEKDLAIVGVIKKLLKELGIKEKSTVISLPESQVYTRVVEMPFLEEPDLTSAIKWQAEQYIPVPLADVNLKHQVLTLPKEGVPDSKMNVLLVAAPNALLSRYMTIVSRAGLEIIAIETEIFAAARSLIAVNEVSPTTMLINMGAESGTLSILKRGDLALTQPINFSGMAITRAVVSELGLEVPQAEEYKKSFGLDSSKLDGKLAKAIKPLLDAAIEELKRVIAFYETHFGSDPIKRIVLSGGGCLLPGLVPYFTQNLNYEVQLGNPFENIFLSDSQKQAISEASPMFATPVGLAMKLT